MRRGGETVQLAVPDGSICTGGDKEKLYNLLYLMEVFYTGGEEEKLYNLLYLMEMFYTGGEEQKPYKL